MSIAARAHLCDMLVFQRQSQRADLMDPAVTQTSLIALLLEIAQQYHLEVTAVRSDHHDDSSLGVHTHAGGFAVDLWPLERNVAGEYMDASDPKFRWFLEYIAESPWLFQVGLAGSSFTDENMRAAGVSVFRDDGADHIHLGAS